MASPHRKPLPVEDGILTLPDIGHMPRLAVALLILLEEADGLPEPEAVTIYGVLFGHVHDELSLSFPDVPGSAKALAQWAERFGGVITSEVKQRDTGPQLWVKVKFAYLGAVRVDAFAHIPLPETEATDTGPDGEPPF